MSPKTPFLLVVLLLAGQGVFSLMAAPLSTSVDGNQAGGLMVEREIEETGNFQLWLSYHSPHPVTVEVSYPHGAQTLVIPLEQTPHPEQTFRLFLGDLAATQPGKVTLSFDVGETDQDFEFRRLEVLEAPILSDELKPLFSTAMQFYDDLVRTENGLYLDVFLPEDPSAENDICSVAAVGVGLISLAMNHELGRDPDAPQKALQTLRTINAKTAGLVPDREPSGFFRHFISVLDGTGNSEFSTIDTAILTVGALFARNTFDDSEITAEADELWRSVDWSIALAEPDASELYMCVGDDGRPYEDTRTKLFSEYYLLAWLIQQDQMQRFGSSEIEIAPTTLATQTPYRDVTLLTSPDRRMQSSFLAQFSLYLCHPCTIDPLYYSFAGAQAQADFLTSRDRSQVDEFWGCGAGVTPTAGYHAASFEDNPDTIVSPHIIAGFMPVFPEAKGHLTKLFKTPERQLSTRAGKLLPRFSLEKPLWRPKRIESIDHASMLFGLAAIHPRLGMKFFTDKTRLTFTR